MTSRDRSSLSNEIKEFVEKLWSSSVVEKISDYIRIPNQSPSYDQQWETNGLMDKAVELLVDWVKAQQVKGLKLEVVKEKGRTPLIFMEIDPTDEKQPTVLLYGHLDKQPPLDGLWSEGLAPYEPVLRDGLLYGRGGADDGYSTFSAIAAIGALQKLNRSHPRCVIVIESSEESGSPDLPHYVQVLKDRIGSPSLIVCLDSGAGDYEHFWLTTSLRGLLTGNLTVKVLNEAVHSGLASGIVPSSFRILRLLLDRLEDSKTGKFLVEGFDNGIPEQVVELAKKTAQVLGREIVSEWPWATPDSEPVGGKDADLTELLLNKTWRSALSITGFEGLPNLSNAGNVLVTHTSVKLSIRLPPNVSASSAKDHLRKILVKDAPYHAHVEFQFEKEGDGWRSPPLAPWLEEYVQEAAQLYYGKEWLSLGEGGSIPFMGMLGKLFPEAQFIVTGVLGPKANAHGPNEFLHIEMSKRVTCCVAHILHNLAEKSSQQ